MSADPPFFDDLELLRLMLSLDQRGQLMHYSGDQLFREAAGNIGVEAERQAFIRELQIASEDELIGFELIGRFGEPELRLEDYWYLESMRNLRLRSKGRDRARGEVIRQALPEPGQDDGRPIPTRILQQISEAIAEHVHGDETRVLLDDNGFADQELPPSCADGNEALYIHAVLLMTRDRGSSGRRAVRNFVGGWLNDDLDIAPNDGHREQVIAALARRGWHISDGTLVIGERVKAPRTPALTVPAGEAADPKKVMVVHGRDGRANSAMFEFLRALELRPQEWNQLVDATATATPSIGDVLDTALATAQAVVVLFTPDDEARIRRDLATTHDHHDLQGQPRPNVLYEAGLAFGRHPRRTILVELGALRGLSDLFGLHTVRLDDGVEQLHALAQRLKTAGCDTNTSGTQWLDADRFAAAAATSAPGNSRTRDIPPDSTPSVSWPGASDEGRITPPDWRTERF